MVNQNKKIYEQKFGDLYNPRKAVLSQPQESKIVKQSKELKEKVIKEEPTSRTINVIHKHVHNVNNPKRQANIVKNENNIVSNTEDIIKLLTKLRKESQERRRVLSSISDAANVDSIAKNLEQKVQESIKQQKKVAPIVNNQKSELTELKNILLSHKNMIQNLEKKISQSQSKPPVINVRIGDKADKEKSEAAAMEVKKYKGAMKRYQVLFNKYRKLYMKELSHFKKLKGSCARQRQVTQVAKKALQKHEVENAMKSEDRNIVESQRVESQRVESQRVESQRVESQRVESQRVENVADNPQAIKAIIKKVRKVPIKQSVESAVESCPKRDKSCPSELEIVLKRVSRKEATINKKIGNIEGIIKKINNKKKETKKAEAVKKAEKKLARKAKKASRKARKASRKARKAKKTSRKAEPEAVKKIEKERKEKARKAEPEAVKKIEKERKEKARKEKERKEKARKERKEKARKEKERKKKERKEKAIKKKIAKKKARKEKARKEKVAAAIAAKKVAAAVEARKIEEAKKTAEELAKKKAAGKKVVVSKPIAHFIAENYSNNKNWKNIVGGKPNATKWTGNSTVQNHTNNGKSFKAIKFERNDGVRFDEGISTPNYTIIAVGRNRRKNGRVIEGTSGNVLHGWWAGRTGVYHYGRWITHNHVDYKQGVNGV